MRCIYIAHIASDTYVSLVPRDIGFVYETRLRIIPGINAVSSRSSNSKDQSSSEAPSSEKVHAKAASAAVKDRALVDHWSSGSPSKSTLRRSDTDIVRMRA